MATQSSTTVMFRALVMLVCLVAIPLAAVFGKSLPEMVKMLLGRNGSPPAISPAGVAGQSADGNPGAPVPVVSITPGRQMGAIQQGGALQPGSSGIAAATPPSAPAVVPAGFQSAEAPAGRGVTGERFARVLFASEPAAFQPPGTPATLAPDQFTAIRERLQQLGASHYQLEYRGNLRQTFHFDCRVAVQGDHRYEHYFMATDPDPLEAMARVLQQVEAWRAGSR